MGRPYFCNCHCPKPVPWLGYIQRHVYATSITDYNSLSDDTWNNTDMPVGYWYNFSSGHHWTTTQVNAYYYILSISDIVAGDSLILNPIRFSIDEAAAAGNNFDFWQPYEAGVTPIWSDVNAVAEYSGTRQGFQPLSSSTLLPVSGNSHIADGSPNELILMYDQYEYLHLEGLAWLMYTYAGWSRYPNTRPPFGNAVNTYEGGIRPKYVQFRKNGSAYGTLIDMTDIINATESYYSEIDNSTGKLWGRQSVYNLSFKFNNHPWYGMTGTIYKDFVLNRVFEFTAGDTLEIDVWYEIIGGAWYDSAGTNRTGTGARTVIGVIPRHRSSDSSRVIRKESSEPTINAWWGMAASFLPRTRAIQLNSLEVSPTFDPAFHTYQIVADDGDFTFGKAELSGSTAFTITSQGLTWSFERSDTTDPIPGEGNSEWESVNGAPWSLTANNCTIGVPVEPDYDPPAPTIPPSITATFGTCQAPGSGRTVRITVYMYWDKEMPYVEVTWYWAAATVDGTYYPVVSARRYYRPESNSDYVDSVTARIDGTVKSGPTGTFDYAGTTTFTRWGGTQKTTTYDPDAWGTGATDDDFGPKLANSFTVTKVNQ